MQSLFVTSYSLYAYSVSRGMAPNYAERGMNMATQITNQATLTYQYGTSTASAASNIATATLQDPLTLTKSALDAGYRAGEDITYILTAANTSANALTNLTLRDNLGAYTPVGGTALVTPLTYTGPAQLYINGVLSGTLTPAVTAEALTFTVPSLAAGSTAMVLYKARPNAAALLGAEDSLTNTVTAAATGLTQSVSASYTLNALPYANVSILKAMSPAVITDGDTITYTFTLSNSGNTAATGVVLTDVFSPAPSNLTVSVNGTALTAADYAYTGGVLTLPAAGSAYALTVPAAAFSQDSTTGAVTVAPGVATVVVTGTL